jgi:hypothetical protein
VDDDGIAGEEERDGEEGDGQVGCSGWTSGGGHGWKTMLSCGGWSATAWLYGRKLDIYGDWESGTLGVQYAFLDVVGETRPCSAMIAPHRALQSKVYLKI